MDNPLSPDLLRKMNAYWRAANYLSVGQIYLYDNPLLKVPLKLEHIKPRLLGHWGTTPGLNFIYVHLNRLIRKHDLNVLYITGPGHGGPGLVANTYLEGTYSEIYPNISRDEEGMKRLFTQFSFPGGIPSHVAPETPGSIHEGGELGYSLSHAFGAALDNPDLLVACVVGDGEAETGPLATGWHGNKFLDPATDGAVLPILHLNGYKIANPTILARIGREELEELMRGYGYHPHFVEGDDPEKMHQLMAATLDRVLAEIQRIQADARAAPSPPAPLPRSGGEGRRSHRREPMTSPRISRRTALKCAAAGLAAPFVFRAHAAAPSETIYHASFGANGMALSDIYALTGIRAKTPYKHIKLVAVADVDLRRTAEIRKNCPDVRVYQDWRELLDKEKNLNSVNVSTPDHMHAPITMRAMQQGLHVYTQKPLTQTIYEARQLTKTAAEKKLVTQMGIQIHSHPVHRQVVATIQAGAIGKVKEVHSWSGKGWGDKNPRPDRSDPVPEGFNWDYWLGVAAERPFIGGEYYHPSNWRKRLDFGTGTFGDMGCHILDPVYGSLALTAPNSVRSEKDEAPNEHNWSLNVHVRYDFPSTRYTTETLTLHWYNGADRPPQDVLSLLGDRKLHDQGSIYLGTDGVLYSPYIAAPVLLPVEKFKDYKLPSPGGEDHYQQFIQACRGNGKTSAPFTYSGPLTETVLLGCLATRFPKTTLDWNAEKLRVMNVEKANAFVRRRYRKGWEVEGL